MALPNFSRIQNIEHHVGRAARHEQDAVKDHRESTERSVTFLSVRPHSFYDLLYTQDECQDEQAGQVHDQTADGKFGSKSRSNGGIQGEKNDAAYQKDLSQLPSVDLEFAGSKA
jgi:hypothetical protein